MLNSIVYIFFRFISEHSFLIVFEEKEKQLQHFVCVCIWPTFSISDVI